MASIPIASRPLRVAFISEHYPPTEGGVATSTQRVARSLVRLGADVHVLCFDHSRPLQSPDYVVDETDEDVRVSRVGPFFLKQAALAADRVPEKLKATFRRRAFTQMLRLLRDERVDLVLSFYILNAGFVAAYVARSLGVPLVAGVRGNDIGRNIFHTERFAVTHWVIAGARHIVAVNTFLRDRLLLAFPDAEARLSVIPNSTAMPPIGADDRAGARRRILADAGWPDNTAIVAFVGTLREKKGVATLLAAFDLLPADSPVRLLVVGPEVSSFEKQVCGEVWSRLVEGRRCWYTGRLPFEAVPSWVAGGDVVAMPSVDDGMANGLLEGMALGLCPVATPIFADVIRDGATGRIVPCNDAAALAATFEELARSPEHTRSLGDAARASLAAWTPADEACAYLALFSQVLEPGACAQVMTS